MDLQSVKQRFGIIGTSTALDRALEVAMRVAPTDLSVVVTGSSGTGKEFFPQIIHAYSARKHNKYIAVNCGAIPEGTIDSELFGHEKGSFTGATDSRKGYFEEANGGTIFLDEVAELPLSTQVRLLRVLQTGEFIRVGSSKSQKTDVRVVAATNKDLQQAVREGKFREDLYYRLNTVPIQVPSLSERREDIYLLFRKFASDIAVQYRMPSITLDEAARQLLENYSWPGNIRQLKNVAEQISAIEETRTITANILARYLPPVETIPVLTRAPVTGSSHDMSDRDIMYRLLFDMSSDIRDMKRILMEVSNERQPGGQHIAGYLPQGSGYLPVAVDHPGMTPPAEDAQRVMEINDDGPAELTKEQAQREAILKALRKHNGKRKEAARDLFISERTLYRKIKQLGIDEY